jgi:hypothetical protein
LTLTKFGLIKAHKATRAHLACRLGRREAATDAAGRHGGAEAAGRHGELLVERHLIPRRRPWAAALASIADVEPREQRAHHLPGRIVPLPFSASPRHRQQSDNQPQPHLLGPEVGWKISRIPSSSGCLSASGPAMEPGAPCCCRRGHGIVREINQSSRDSRSGSEERLWSLELGGHSGQAFSFMRFFSDAGKKEVGCSSSRDLIHRRGEVGPAVRKRWTLRSVHTQCSFRLHTHFCRSIRRSIFFSCKQVISPFNFICHSSIKNLFNNMSFSSPFQYISIYNSSFFVVLHVTHSFHISSIPGFNSAYQVEGRKELNARY